MNHIGRLSQVILIARCEFILFKSDASFQPLYIADGFLLLFVLNRAHLKLVNEVIQFRLLSACFAGDQAQVGTRDAVLVEGAASLRPPLCATSLAVGLHERHLLVQHAMTKRILDVLTISLPRVVVPKLLAFPLILDLLL